MKQCKQCGRTLDESCFRQTKSRSKGIYKSAGPGTKTICRSCESLNIRAHNALKNNDQEAISVLKEHYEKLNSAGYPPVTAAAQRLLGLAAQTAKRCNDALELTQRNEEVLEHANKVRQRLYSSVDEADAAHRKLHDELQRLGLYEEITDLLDDWYMSE